MNRVSKGKEYYPQHKNAFKKSFQRMEKKTPEYEKIKSKNFSENVNERVKKREVGWKIAMNKYCFRLPHTRHRI